jgi:hypothetical protein
MQNILLINCIENFFLRLGVPHNVDRVCIFGNQGNSQIAPNVGSLNLNPAHYCTIDSPAELRNCITHVSHCAHLSSFCQRLDQARATQGAGYPLSLTFWWRSRGAGSSGYAEVLICRLLQIRFDMRPPHDHVR